MESRNRDGSPPAVLSRALLCLVAVVLAAGLGSVHGRTAAPAPVERRATLDGAFASTAAHRLAAASFIGGTYVTANGASVNVRVSEAYADADARGQRWAEFFSLLPHGDELPRLQITILTGDELSGTCGDHALGCYRPGELAFTDEVLGGVAPEEVARHEYGHHVAANRISPPWRALDWGPKRWASAAGICADVKNGKAFPGDEGDHYSENPGEVWAETYRIMAERAAGISSALWSIVAGRYFPDDAALAAAQADVLDPWTTGSTVTLKGRFVKGQKKIWQRQVTTRLDGTIVVKLVMPAGARNDVTLFAPDGRTVLGRWTSFTTRTKTISTTVCGQRSVIVRVTRGFAPGPFSVAVTIP